MKSLRNSIFSSMLTVPILVIVLITCISITTDYLKYSREAETLRDNNITLRKELIQERVQETTEYIEYMRSQAENRLKELIKNRVYEAYDIAYHLYDMYKDEYTEEELKPIVAEALRPIRFNDGTGYYFATSLEGHIVLLADQPEYEGMNFHSSTDTVALNLFNDVIDILSNSGEGYYEYKWTKPDAPGDVYTKIAYIKLFEPFNWYVGTGIYADDIEADIQNEILSRLESKDFNDGSYMFAGQWDGLSLTSPSRGENMIDITDQNGVKIVQELIETAKQGGGFVNYIMPQLEGIRSEPKISYVTGIDDWQWYVGTGVYTTDIEQEYIESRKDLIGSLLFNLARNVGILIVFLFFTFIFARRTADKTVKELNIFKEFFRQSATDSVGIDEKTLEYQEFISLAQSANNMLLQRERAEAARRESEEKYRYLVDNATEAIVVAQDGLLKFVNNFFIEFMDGFTEEELTSIPFHVFIHPDDRDMVVYNYQKRIKGGVLPSRYSFRVITKHDDEKWVEINAVLIEWGAKPATLNFLTDITEQKRVEQELIKSEQRYRTYISNISDVIAILDNNLVVKYKSPNITQHFGWEPDDLIGRDGWETVHPDDREYIAHELTNLLVQEGRTKTVQYRYLCKDGSYKFIELSAVNMANDPIIAGILTNYHDITEQRKNSQAVSESEEKFRLAFKTSPDSININKLDGTYIEINDGFTKLTGYTEEDVIGKTSSDINMWVIPEDRDTLIGELKSKGAVQNLQTDFRMKDGEIRTGIMSASIITIQNEPYILSITRDISDRLKLEKQLLQAQRIESVGRLAGGVAHDFNNMLSVILGHTEMALAQIDSNQILFEDLIEIQKAANRSADLTRQLLAFARKQTVEPKILDMNETVESTLKMLKRLIGENIELEWIPDDSVWPVYIDPSQLDQVLANLCVNARDAIDGVGKIIIETGTAVFDQAFCEVHADFTPGEYIMLSISDNGAGMDADTLNNIFEPFYTTKAIGKGTGLGLATVYGVIRQNNGFISVYSEPGVGSTFKIYLPRHTVENVQELSGGMPKEIMHGDETILFVEDELANLKMTTKILNTLGYNVLTASTPAEALQVAQNYNGDIRLLISDVIMPEMNGRELSEQLLDIYPDIKLLFMSGYTADFIAHHGVLEKGVYFLPKPFSIDKLAVKVREVLESE